MECGQGTISCQKEGGLGHLNKSFPFSVVCMIYMKNALDTVFNLSEHPVSHSKTHERIRSLWQWKHLRKIFSLKHWLLPLTVVPGLGLSGLSNLMVALNIKILLLLVLLYCNLILFHLPQNKKGGRVLSMPRLAPVSQICCLIF